MTLDDLPTPALILELPRLKRNLATMTARMAGLGVRLRPHLKVARAAEVGRLAVEGNFGGIAVQQLGEAEFFFRAGFPDIVVCQGIVPAKLDRAAALAAQGCDLTVITDQVAVAEAIAAGPTRLGVAIEIDCGARRGGVSPGEAELLEIARALRGGSGADLRGVLTNAGTVYACRGKAAFEALAEAERAAVVSAAERLRAAGFPCAMVSVGSTGTAVAARALPGVTEARPGLYVFQDLMRAGLGLCAVEDVAVSVLARVIANFPGDRILIDAGITAFSGDRSTAAIEGGDQQFGIVLDRNLREIAPGLRVSALHTEHGWLACPDGLPFARLPVGTPVRVLPNHCNNTATLHRAYAVADGDARVIATWTRHHGW